LELIRRENYTKEQLDVPAGYFEEFQNKNPREIALIGLKHINLKDLMPFVSSLEKNKRLRFLKQSFQKYWLIQTLYIYITTQFSVLQSTISIPQLVKAASGKMPAVAMTDHELDGCFHFVRDILNHNKAEAKMQH
jgi:DNA polymerase-3 subunit alpha